MVRFSDNKYIGLSKKVPGLQTNQMKSRGSGLLKGVPTRITIKGHACNYGIKIVHKLMSWEAVVHILKLNADVLRHLVHGMCHFKKHGLHTAVEPVWPQ